MWAKPCHTVSSGKRSARSTTLHFKTLDAFASIHAQRIFSRDEAAEIARPSLKP
jgi:hypothetical protein